MIKLFGKKSKNKKPGFTLVEILVYLAILMVVSTSSVTFLLSLDDLMDQYRLETILYRSGTDTLEQILLAIRQADRIDPVNTIEDNPTSGKLALVNGVDSTTFTFVNIPSGTRLDLDINDNDYGNMLMDGVTVDDFTVYHYDMAVGNLVRVRLTLTATLAPSGASKTITLYGGAVIRGDI